MVKFIAGFIAGFIFVSTLVLYEFARELSAVQAAPVLDEEDEIPPPDPYPLSLGSGSTVKGPDKYWYTYN